MFVNDNLLIITLTDILNLLPWKITLWGSDTTANVAILTGEEQ